MAFRALESRVADLEAAVANLGGIVGGGGSVKFGGMSSTGGTSGVTSFEEYNQMLKAGFNPLDNTAEVESMRKFYYKNQIYDIGFDHSLTAPLRWGSVTSGSNFQANYNALVSSVMTGQYESPVIGYDPSLAIRTAYAGSTGLSNSWEAAKLRVQGMNNFNTMGGNKNQAKFSQVFREWHSANFRTLTWRRQVSLGTQIVNSAARLASMIDPSNEVLQDVVGGISMGTQWTAYAASLPYYFSTGVPGIIAAGLHGTILAITTGLDFVPGADTSNEDVITPSWGISM